MNFTRHYRVREDSVQNYVMDMGENWTGFKYTGSNFG